MRRPDPIEPFRIGGGRAACCLAPLLLLACSPQANQVPSNALLDRIERQLPRDECIADLSRWARYYRFDTASGEVDTNTILIDLHQAGMYGYREGRYTRPPREELVFEIDDRPYLIGSGRYKVREGRLILESCGPNMPE